MIHKFLIIFFIGLIIFLKLTKFNIKVSVIIPTYNRGKLIGNSIKSVLNQTYKNLEIIVVDDGSTDNTKEEVEKIKDEKIRYIKLEKNGGAANARNIGIMNSTGRYISFQDSDDIMYPNKLEIQIKNLINKNSNLDFCKIKVINNSTYSYFIPNPLQEKNILEGNIFDELLSGGNFISTQSIVVRKKFMKNYLFDPIMPRLQDYEVILRMIPKVKISYTNKVLIDLHLQNDSITRVPYKLKKAIHILLKKNFNFNAKRKEAFENYLNYLLNLLFNKK